MSQVRRNVTIGGGLALALAIASLALSLSTRKNNQLANVLLYVAAGVFVFTVLWVVLAWLAARFKRIVVSWIHAEMISGSGGGAGDIVDPKFLRYAAARRAHMDVRENKDLRKATNEISEELEYAREQIVSNEAAYWSGYRLPSAKWEHNGGRLAEWDDEAHKACRYAYKQVDRLNHALDAQDPRRWDESGDFITENRYLESGHRPEDATNAIDSALRELERVRQEIIERLTQDPHQG
jgi:hypothetical protein